MGNFYKDLFEKLRRNYKPGDALLLYIALDDIIVYRHLYQSITKELKNTNRCKLSDYNDLEKFEKDRWLCLWHAYDENIMEKTAKRWMSAALFDGAIFYSKHLVRPFSKVRIVQVDMEKVTHAYNVYDWIINNNLMSRINFYMEDIKTEYDVYERIYNEQEYIIRFSHNPLR